MNKCKHLYARKCAAPAIKLECNYLQTHWKRFLSPNDVYSRAMLIAQNHL